MLRDKVIHLVALIPSGPQGTMGLVFILQTFMRNGMRRDMGSSKAMLTDYQKPTREMPSQPAYISTARTCQQPLPFPAPMTSSSSEYFTTHSLPCFAPLKYQDFCVPSPLRVSHKWPFVVPCDSKEQNLIAQELPVYPMLLTLKTITTFKILEVNGENLSSVGLYRQNTKNCPAPIH